MDFSVIIPAKNEERNIANCLDSINQIDYARDKFEVIVVDNGSSDRTVEVATDKGARVFVQPELTISGLRNFGARQAKGKILAFLDADCTVAMDWLTEAARYLEDQSVACFGAPPTVPENATWVQKSWLNVRKKEQQVTPVEWLESMNMFIPEGVFSEIGGFDEGLVTCEDYDLSIRLHKHGQILADQRIVAVHHGEAADLGHFFRKEHWRATSNRARLLEGTFKLAELPSLLVPPVYCLLAFLFVVFLVLFGFFDRGNLNGTVLFFLLIWQLPILLLAFRKLRGPFSLIAVGQLFALLNVYFLARGLAVFRKG